MSYQLFERQAASSLTAKHHRSVGIPQLPFPAPMDLCRERLPVAVDCDAMRFAEASRNSQAKHAFRPALSVSDWHTFASFCISRRLPAGSRVMVAGELDRTMRLVIEGSLCQVRASRPWAESSLSSLRLPGCIVGEDALFADSASDLDVFAVEDSHLLELTWLRKSEMSAMCPEIAFEILRAAGAVIAARRSVVDIPTRQANS